jgi:SAM-dependent methyltransferase
MDFALKGSASFRPKKGTVQESMPMRIRTFETIDEFRSALNLEMEGFIAEPDIDIVETECDFYERKRRDAEVLCTLASNVSGNCLDLGTSYGKSAYELAMNIKGRGTVYTVNILPEQLNESSGQIVTHILTREQIGEHYRNRDIKNVRQIYADTSKWDPPEDLRGLKLAFVNAAHDTHMVHNDSVKAYSLLDEGGYIVWHDFNPALRNRHDWIDHAMKGVDLFCEQFAPDAEVFHLKNSWMGVLRKGDTKLSVSDTHRRQQANPTAKDPHQSSQAKNSDIVPHKMMWDEAKVHRFWDFTSTSQVGLEEYFSFQVGRGVANFLAMACSEAVRGKILDYGCGPGFLLDHLAEFGGGLAGVDASPASIEAVEKKMRGRPGWEGAKVSTDNKLPFPDGFFNLVTCVETIEHVLPEKMEGLLSELRRVLRQDSGLLFLTTPFEERLDRSAVFCPECGATFHRWQHLRSFGRTSLSQLMEQNGFRTRLCVNLNFGDFQDAVFPGLGSPDLPAWFTARLGYGPHLVWIGYPI